MQLKCFIIIFCHIYLPNINHHIKSLMWTEMQHIQLLLRCEYSQYVSDILWLHTIALTSSCNPIWNVVRRVFVLVQAKRDDSSHAGLISLMFLKHLNKYPVKFIFTLFYGQPIICIHNYFTHLYTLPFKMNKYF